VPVESDTLGEDQLAYMAGRAILISGRAVRARRERSHVNDQVTWVTQLTIDAKPTGCVVKCEVEGLVLSSKV
jgi:hypothetical protein